MEWTGREQFCHIILQNGTGSSAHTTSKCRICVEMLYRKSLIKAPLKNSSNLQSRLVRKGTKTLPVRVTTAELQQAKVKVKDAD